VNCKFWLNLAHRARQGSLSSTPARFGARSAPWLDGDAPGGNRHAKMAVLVAFLVPQALLSPDSLTPGRRVVLNRGLQALAASAGVGICGLVFTERVRLDSAPAPDALSEGDELFPLRSQNDLAPTRAALEEEWQALRQQRPSAEETRGAFQAVLRLRDSIDEASVLAEARRWDELDAVLPASAVLQFERAATVLARSAALAAEERAIIGWQWGACGWRRCGAQADVSQALAKLRENLGMIVPLEALFYLDVAKRAADEIVAVGVSASMLPREAMRDRSYLPIESLELILPAEDLASGDANLRVVRGGASEAEDALDDYEAGMLGTMQQLVNEDGEAGG